MVRTLLSAARLLVLMTILTGIVYPLTITGLAQVLFSEQAKGSILSRGGAPVGSRLIGQNFAAPAYFHGRPSAAGKDGYDAANSAGSNLGPTNRKLLEVTINNVAKIREENGLPADAKVPADLVTASASGLDPHISPAAAYLQVERITQARRLPAVKVRNLVERHIQDRQLGLLGEPRVNVLELNIALDELQSKMSVK